MTPSYSLPQLSLESLPWAGEPKALHCQENQLPSLLWNLQEFLEEGEGVRERARPTGRVSGVGVCLCARDWSRAVFGGGQGCFGSLHAPPRAGGRGFSLLPFIGFNIPESARLLSLSWLGRQAGQACRPPPLFLIPASLGMRRLEKAPPDHLGFRGVGAGEGPVLLHGCGRPPHQSPQGKCNKALTFL